MSVSFTTGQSVLGATTILSNTLARQSKFPCYHLFYAMHRKPRNVVFASRAVDIVYRPKEYIEREIESNVVRGRIGRLVDGIWNPRLRAG